MLQAFLEQFEILQLILFNLTTFDFSTNIFLLINVLISFIIFIYLNGVQKKILLFKNSSSQESSFFFSPNSWQKIIESEFEIVSQLISDRIYKNNEKYFPIISILFNFILFSNLVGLVPYSFISTSHLIVTFTLLFAVFVGINIITFKKYKMKIFSLFLPFNVAFFLSLLLVSIEFISWIATSISLGIRLFINLMAGHSLLKVIVGFSWSMLLLENTTSMGLILPMIVFTILSNLELGIALIQTYVFIILTCIYIQNWN